MWYDLGMKITLYGFGYVGRALFEFFKDHYEIQVFDPHFPEGTDALHQKYPGHFFTFSRKEIEPTDHALIAVPTPMDAAGACDLSHVIRTISESNHKFYFTKSTIVPGTTEKLAEETGKKICFSPEYIGEGKYIVQWWKDKGYPHPTDMKYHNFQIFGGDPEAKKEFIELFKKVVGPEVIYAQASNAKTAEFVKYAENLWGAMKVTFFNELAEACEAAGIDYDEMRELLLLDGRIEKMHTAVFKDKRGFSGKCYPKDVDAFIHWAESIGFNPKLIKAMWNKNIDLLLNHGAALHGNPDWAKVERKHPIE